MDNATKSIKKLSLFLGIAVIIITASYGVLIIFLTWPISGFSIDKAGVYGDSFGLITALFSGLAFVGLIATILLQREDLRMQRDELSLTRDELRKQNDAIKNQNFESTFFQMLRLHNDILNSINIIGYDRGEAESISGRDSFVKFYTALRHKYESDRCDVRANAQGMPRFMAAYELFWEEYQYSLGHYFRYLYNIFKFIKNSNIANKRLYTNIVRAQLSDQELLLLFYNCLYIYGSEKFKPLVEGFAILNNLPVQMLLDIKHKELYADSAYE